VVSLTDQQGQRTLEPELFQANIDRFDRDALLDSLQHLARAVESADLVPLGASAK